MPARGRRQSSSRTREARTRVRLRWWWAGVVAAALVLAPSGRAPADPGVRLAVIVNPAMPVTTLGATELASIYTRAMRTWKDGTMVRALNLPANSPERVEFDRVVLDMTPERSAQYWIDKQIRGEEPAPKAIGQADIVVRLVPTLSGSIGYVPEDKVDAKVRVVARIRGSKVLAP
jgi:hypothetical protein